MIEIPHPVNSNHNGGQVQFGPDGYLYLALGDGGAGGDPRGNAQNPESLLGKLLRIEPKPKGGYSVPDSNPFAGGAGRDEIFATGLRNPYRFSFDSQSGALSIGDVGQDSWEEIDHVGADRARGANFGWDLFEGTHVYDGDGSQPANYVPPIHEYSLDGGTCPSRPAPWSTTRACPRSQAGSFTPTSAPARCGRSTPAPPTPPQPTPPPGCRSTARARSSRASAGRST